MLKLQDELRCGFVLAQVLTRRGLSDPKDAREFLSAAERHLPEQFERIGEAIALIREHVQRGDRITVHGDYDVDGVTATAIVVGALRDLGADCDWFIPGRSEDGYGLAADTVRRLHERGTKLLITVDCGITAVAEVELAHELGMKVVITDHHSLAADGRLPDAPTVHPVVGNYPCSELCGAAVAHKLIGALCGEPRADKDLDLVALATVADCVPLRGENRRLVRDGIKAIATTRRPGLRALMSVADVDPSRLDATSIAFRLAPRINAAGRVHRADAGVELLLTDDPQRGREISEQLDQRNAERRHIEQRIRFEAEAQVAEQGERMAYVLAGDDWHPGVIGIVASRIAERHNRPTVMIAFDGDQGTASGRSIAAYDLLNGLNASADYLLRHGGHRAAAGATIERSQLDSFRAALEAHAAANLSEADLVAVERVDAVVSGNELGTELAEELSQLAPFGIGNPQISLLVPSARLTDRQMMGEGKHLRFSVQSGGVSARAVAFGTTKLPEGELLDAAFELELNEFRGAIEPRLLFRGAVPTHAGPIELVGDPEPGSQEWLAQVLQGSAALVPSEMEQMQRIGGREPVDRRGYGVAGTIAALVHTGEPVLVVVADTRIRAKHLTGRLGGFGLTSWGAIARDPSIADRFDHVIALDPPMYADQMEAVRGAPGAFRLHLAWGADELRFVYGLLADQHAPRSALSALYRSLREGGLAAVDQPAWQVSELLAVFVELGLATSDGALLQSAGKQDLERSIAFRALAHRNQEALQWLSSAKPIAA